VCYDAEVWPLYWTAFCTASGTTLQSASDNRFYKTLHAFGSVVQQIAEVGDGEVTVDDLLNAPPFKTISYNDKNVDYPLERERYPIKFNPFKQ